MSSKVLFQYTHKSGVRERRQGGLESSKSATSRNKGSELPSKVYFSRHTRQGFEGWGGWSRQRVRELEAGRRKCRSCSCDRWRDSLPSEYDTKSCTLLLRLFLDLNQGTQVRRHPTIVVAPHAVKHIVGPHS